MRQEQAHSSGMGAEGVDELSPTKKQDYKKMEQLKKKPQVHNHRQWLSCGLGFISYRRSKLDGRVDRIWNQLELGLNPSFI